MKNLLIGLIIGLLLISGLSLITIKSDFVKIGNVYVEKELLPRDIIDPTYYLRYCGEKDVNLDNGTYKLTGNWSWIKEYYRPDIEFGGQVKYHIKKSYIPFLLKDELVLDNFTFMKYGNSGSTGSFNIEHANYTGRVHSHPDNGNTYGDNFYNRFSNFNDYSEEGGDMSVIFADRSDIGKTYIHILVGNSPKYKDINGNSQNFSDIIISDWENPCGLKYKVNDEGSIS
jgi:hypothetical protein